MDPPHMAGQKQDDQLEHTFSSYVRMRDVALKTCQRRWTIGKSGERGSGISVLAARHDDDDDDIYIYIFVNSLIKSKMDGKTSKIITLKSRANFTTLSWWNILRYLNTNAHIHIWRERERERVSVRDIIVHELVHSYQYLSKLHFLLNQRYDVFTSNRTLTNKNRYC